MKKEQLLEQLENLKNYIPEEVNKASHDRILANANEKRDNVLEEIRLLEMKLANNNNYAITNKAYDAGFLAAKGLEKLAGLTEEEFESYEQDLMDLLDSSRTILGELTAKFNQLAQRINENENRLEVWQKELEELKSRAEAEPQNQELANELAQKESEVRGLNLNLESFRHDLTLYEARINNERNVLAQRTAEQKGIEEFKNRPREIDVTLRNNDEETLSGLKENLLILEEDIKDLENNNITEIDELIESVKNDEIGDTTIINRLNEFKEQVPAVEIAGDISILSGDLEDVRLARDYMNSQLEKTEKGKTKNADDIKSLTLVMALLIGREKELKHAINEKGSIGSEIDDLVEGINNSPKKVVKVKKSSIVKSKKVAVKPKTPTAVVSSNEEPVVAEDSIDNSEAIILPAVELSEDDVVEKNKDENEAIIPPIVRLSGEDIIEETEPKVGNEYSDDSNVINSGAILLGPAPEAAEDYVLIDDNTADSSDLENDGELSDDSIAAMLQAQDDILGSEPQEVEGYEDNATVSEREINKANKKVRPWIKRCAVIAAAVAALIVLLVSCGKSKDEANKIATEMPSEQVIEYVENEDRVKEDFQEEIEVVEDNVVAQAPVVAPVVEETPVIEDLTETVVPPIEDLTDAEKENDDINSTPNGGSGSEDTPDINPTPGDGSGSEEKPDINPGNPGGGSGEEEKPDINPENPGGGSKPGDEPTVDPEPENPVEEEITVTVNPGDAYVYDGPEGDKTVINLGTDLDSDVKDFTEVENNGINDVDVNKDGGLDVTFDSEVVERPIEEQENFDEILAQERAESEANGSFSQEELDNILAAYGALYGTSDVTYTNDLESGKTR